MPDPKKPVESLSFEEALAELQKIVGSLESGQTALDDSIAAYERGVTLKTHCEKKLRDAQSKIEKISLAADGTLATAPFGTQE